MHRMPMHAVPLRSLIITSLNTAQKLLSALGLFPLRLDQTAKQSLHSVSREQRASRFSSGMNNVAAEMQSKVANNNTGYYRTQRDLSRRVDAKLDTMLLFDQPAFKQFNLERSQ